MHLSTAVHAVSTAFPLVLVFVLLVLEFIVAESVMRNRVRVILLSLLGCSVVVAFSSGLLAQHHASTTFTVPEQDIDLHFQLARAAIVVVAVAVTLGVLRELRTDGTAVLGVLYKSFLVLSLTLLVATGHYGSSLVYEHGAGVVVSQRDG